MRDILVTSSVLILALLVLRQVFRRTISRRVQYALWGLVLLRLLAPVNLPAMEHNVLTTAEAVSQQISPPVLYIEPVRETVEGPADVPVLDRQPTDYQQAALDSATQDNTRVFTDQKNVTHTVEYARQVSLTELLRPIWYAGVAVMACWLVVSNLRFWQKLRKVRKPYSVENCRYRVYLVESGLPSPCLFGLFRPAIYLTPAATASPESLRHVLAHETTHARHLDPLWSLLRGVCLAVYWFDPLVWIAAAVSKTDCELACDEGALKRLGAAERIAYGRTLLALIPVAKRHADPMLAATTMTSGKRRLKDRITRIAENRQTVSAALFAAVALAGLVCAVTFTGAKVAAEEVALTGEELTYFNKTFFNGGTVGVNIHNQFLTSLYAQPEDIDLYSLFYLLGSTPGDAEIRAVFQAGPDALSYPAYRITAGEMDAVLSENTGLTLAETHQVSLDRFEVYDPANSAYYWVTGDAGPGDEIVFSAGTREQDTVRLYYTAQFYSGSLYSGWACVTLEAQADGGYRFVSNLACEQPAIPTVYPEGDPVLTIPLTGLAPYEPPAVETQRFAVGTGRSRVLAQYSANDQSIVVCRTFNGGTGVGVENDGAYDCFLYFTAMQEQAADSLTVHSFSGLFGCDGWVVSYYGLIDEVHEQGDGQVTRDSQAYSVATFYRIYGTVNDYYTFADDGSPVLLVRTYGTPQRIDLDGDGSDELVTSGDAAQITFQRDGRLYQADITALLQDRWPEAQYLSFGNWDINSRCLPFSGEVPIPDSDMYGTASRYLYFNGDELLIYRDSSTYTDHINDSIDAPEDVLAAVREYVMSQYAQGVRCYDLVDGDIAEVREEYDDWRITELSGPYYEDIGSLRIEIWQFGYECHTSTQYQVSLAGGSYITEDRWCMIGYPGCDYLYFLLAEDGARTYLYHAMENDCSPGMEVFRTDMVYQLMSMDLLSMTDLAGQTLLDMLWVQPTAFLNRLAEDQTEAVQSAVIGTLGAYLASESSYAVQNTYASCVSYAATLNADFTEAGRALWEQLQDRIAEGAQEAVISAPPAVLAAAQEKAAAEFASFRALATDGAQYDDWRISYLSLAAVCDDYSVTVAVYQMGCAYHAARPEAVSLAGSMEMTGDGWVGGFHSNYLVFSLDGGRYTLLDGRIAFDTAPDAPAFQVELVTILLKNGLVELSELDADTLLHMFYVGYPPYFLNLVGTYSAAERTSVIKALNTFHNRGDEYDRGLFRDAMQTAAWCVRDLDANGRTFWGELLNYTGITPSGIGGSYSDLTTAVHQAILHDLENASAQTCDFHAEAHRVLDTVQSGNTCTVYLLMQVGGYGLTDGGYQLVTGGIEAAALTFATINGQYQLIEFWTPPGGADDTSGIRTCFPTEAAETAVNPDASLLETLQNQLDAAAAESFSQAKGFTKADVEFTGQALTASADTMSYEERLDWCERGGSIEQGIGFHIKTFLSQDGYIAYAGNMTGVSPGASAWKYLYLRFPDGTLAELPLPKNALYSTPLPDTLSFADGKLVYGVSFSDELADGGTLVHLAGTYHYEVDLPAKTVSLTVLDN